MTRSPVFLPASDKYLPLIFALLPMIVVIAATQTWGIAVLKEQFVWLAKANELAAGAKLSFVDTNYPAGPLWPLLLSYFAKSGFAIEFVARIWQGLMLGLLLYTITRFYLRHLLSRVVVAGASLAALTGFLLLSEAFSLSPLPTALLFCTLGLLALARFLLEEEVLAFIAATVCIGVATLMWFPAVVIAIGCALAILLGGRGNLGRRFSGVIFFSAAAWIPALYLLSQVAAPQYGLFGGTLPAIDSVSAWTMWSTWPMWLRVLLTLAVLIGLLYVYLATRGPAGIGPALKRRELQVWILLCCVWLLHLLLFPLTTTMVVLIPAFVLWPALGIDSFRDFQPVSNAWSGKGTTVAVWSCLIILLIPVWQAGAFGWRTFQAGDGVRGFEFQSSSLLAELRTDQKRPIYSDNPELLTFAMNREIKKLPDDLKSLDLVESRVVVLGDSCPPGLCKDDSATHPTLTFASKLAVREGLLYDVTFRAPEPALTASDSLTIP